MHFVLINATCRSRVVHELHQCANRARSLQPMLEPGRQMPLTGPLHCVGLPLAALAMFTAFNLAARATGWVNLACFEKCSDKITKRAKSGASAPRAASSAAPAAAAPRAATKTATSPTGRGRNGCNHNGRGHIGQCDSWELGFIAS